MRLSASRFRTAPTGGPTVASDRWASVRDLARPSRYRSEGDGPEERPDELPAAPGPADRTVVVVAFDASAVDASVARRDLRAAVEAVVAGRSLDAVTEDRPDGLLLLVRAPPVRVMRDLLPAVVGRLRAPGPPHMPPVRLTVHDGSVDYAVRLGDHPSVRRVLTVAARSSVVVVVSSDVYEAVIAPGHAGGLASSYAPVVLDDERRAWIRIPGYARPPVEDDPPRLGRSGSAAPIPARTVFMNSVVNGPVYGGDHIDLRGGDRG